MKKYLIFLLVLISQNLYAQYSMSNATVYDCTGTLTDSEANAVNSGWYDHNENFLFTICPSGALSITISFSFFETEPGNDYVIIYDGPDDTYPVIGGPYSGMTFPPQIVSSGCVTIGFISDVNVAAPGFALNWISDVTIPSAPVISLPNSPICSTNMLTIQLNQKIHCDSVYSAQIGVSGQLNQIINAIPINCINDSTNTIQLNLLPGLNESGVYSISLQSFFKDDCDSIWNLSTSYQFIINDCPLQISINASPDSVICQGDCVDLYVNVSGGDSTTYSYVWAPALPNSPGPHNVCPSINTIYSVTVSDTGPALDQTENILIAVLTPPVAQPDFSICQTDSPINLIANPAGGSWSGNGIINSNNGVFSPVGLAAGVYTVTYSLGSCSDDVNITVLAVNAGLDISACLNAPTFNLNTAITSPAGGVWSGCNCIQTNGDITVGNVTTLITAIYTLPNGCVDTLLVNVGGISTQQDDTLCQKQGAYTLAYSPPNGIWSVLPDNILQPSICLNPINIFPFQDDFELGLGNWLQDPTNDFDWEINSGGTPSAGTGPVDAFEGFNYIYTEASNGNNPSKKAAIISPCLNLSAYNNPFLHFWYHKYGNNQGSFAVDVSIDNGASWTWNHWYIYGDLGNQWQSVAIDLSMFNFSEVKVRLRVITGDGSNGQGWQSDVAVDKLSILGGPITVEGDFLSNVADSGIHNLVYSIQGCDDYVNLYVKEVDAGSDQIVCPSQSPFNLVGTPNSGTWSGTHITNTFLGTFDPSLGLGIDVITYSVNGCIDTAEIKVVDTDVQVSSIEFCVNEGSKIFLPALIPRAPYNGLWSGPGVTNPNFPGDFSTIIAGAGVHLLTYTANNCSDDLTVIVHPNAILIDTLICSTSADILLDVLPSGGNWYGNGILNSSTGLFSPSSLPIGTNYLLYESLTGCIDTFAIEIYNSPVLSMSGLVNQYCFIDSNIQVTVNPIGGVLSGNGINGNIFNPALAGMGYHLISYSYGSGNCLQTIDTVVFVSDQIIVSAYQSGDTICAGDIVSIGVNTSGGIGNYTFDWDNGLSSSFQHLVEPIVSTNYIVQVSDGCSDDVIDSIQIIVQPTFSNSFITSSNKCYGAIGFAKVLVSPSGSYSYQWDSNPLQISDSLVSLVNKTYQVQITDNISLCSIIDTVTIPGYDNLLASFFPNTTECVSLLSADFQFLDNSTLNANELSLSSYWDFGDGTIIPYVFTENPTHEYADTGSYLVQLHLENKGGCSDSAAYIVCVNPDMKIHVPNSFTPNNDNCNDEFYIKGAGGFYSFNIKIHKRWGSEVIFESNEIIETTQSNDGNICNTVIDNNYYCKMGSWNGVMNNGLDAPQGIYPYIINYIATKESPTVTLVGFIILLK
jgi:hypothetical protein